MQTEYYEEFLTLSITKNFSEAAVQLHISQPTLSRHMDILEKDLRCQLFTRTRPISLTPNGQKILPYIANIVRANDELNEHIKSIRSTSYEELKIQDLSFSQTAHNLLTQCEHSAQTEYPETVFRHVDPRIGKSLLEQIEEGILDIAFAQGFGKAGQITPPEVSEDILTIEIPLLKGNLCFVGKSGNPLFDSTKIPLLSDFKNTTFLSPTLRYLNVFRRSFSNLCETFGGFTPRFDFRETDCHSNFYAQDPGDSLYILVANKGEEDHTTLPPWLAKETSKIILPQYECATYALVLHKAQNPGIETLLKNLKNSR